MRTIPGTRVPLASLLALTLPACSDFATEPDREPASVRVAPDTVYLVEGDHVTFTLDVLDQNGIPYDGLPAWAPPIWTSATPERFEMDGQGTGFAREAGQTWTRVDIAGLVGRALVRANPVEMGLDVAFVYITQSVQREDGAVPLIAGRDGLLRVYLSGSSPNFFRPAVHATFYRNGAVVHSAALTFEHVGIPQNVDEGNLELSYDAMVPGSVIQPGLGVVVEVDPGGVVPAVEGSTMRVPTTGELPLDVVNVPPFRLRLVPVTQSLNGRESVFAPGNADLILRLAADLFPFAEFDIDVREPYTTTANLESEGGWYELIEEIAFLRLDDESSRYYYGGFQITPGTRILGLGYVGYPVAIGVDDRDGTIAHEIGHTLGLAHAPCGDPAGVDIAFPYEDGSTGRYGYDRSRNAMLRPNETYDLMSYCDPIWISDYNYRRVMAYRDTSEYDMAFEEAATGSVRRTGQMLVVRGGVVDGQLRLEPGLVWTAPPAVPEVAGRYELEGFDAGGATLFRLRFEPKPLDHLSGSTFLMSLPADGARTDRLHGLRLSGPEGTVERVRSARSAAVAATLATASAPGAPGSARVGQWDATAYPLAVVRDRDTGRILAMSKTGRVRLPDRGLDELEVLFSDGVGTRPGRLLNR